DDYIRKPFRADELLARVRAVMRRTASRAASAAAAPSAALANSGWELDLRRHEIRWKGAVVQATTIEFRLLRMLVERLGELVPHRDLLEAGWPDVPDPDPLWLKSHVARLRDKLISIGAPTPVAV